MRTNRPTGPAPRRSRLIVTALLEDDGRLLLGQLATGRFAGFWLLPSATVEESSLIESARLMARARTGRTVGALSLASVVEEPRAGVLALRFVFAGMPGATEADPDHELRQVRAFTREEAVGVVTERDAVPTLGVMALIRAWGEGIAPRALETLPEDVQCPCGSGFTYKGCCGWDSH